MKSNSFKQPHTYVEDFHIRALSIFIFIYSTYSCGTIFNDLYSYFIVLYFRNDIGKPFRHK